MKENRIEEKNKTLASAEVYITIIKKIAFVSEGTLNSILLTRIVSLKIIKSTKTTKSCCVCYKQTKNK